MHGGGQSETTGAATWHLADVLAATSGEVVRLGGTRWYAGVSTDTRRLGSGQLFVALRGKQHDGHAFAAAAAAGGAAALVVEEVPAELDGAPAAVVVVPDTLRALGDLASYHRRRLGLRVAAVTGSNGKTTTKEMIASIMGAALGPEQVLHTSGTENNLVGLPLTLLRATGREAVAVLELGMNAPGEIWRLTEIAAPDVGVVTCVGPAHLEGLGTLAGVARAKGELFRRLRPEATAVVNADDPLVADAAAGFAGPRIRFGAGADVAAEAIAEDGLEGVAFVLVAGGQRQPVRLPLPGRHNVSNALAAAAVATALGAPLAAVVAGLERLPRLAMRMEIVTLPGPLTVINDAYNANPASMRSALATLAGARRGQAAIAVLGEMRELGAESAALHHEIGRAAAAAGVDALVVLGGHAGDLRAGAIAGGLPAAAVAVATSHAEAAACVRAFARAGDCVLLKGSRGSRMEEVLAHLRAGA
jgi:UDP-N-acetylmuramoyl-tripeptide--D-alanyl-D-alanine ligase